MELDFSEEWRILAPSTPAPASSPAAFAARELASVIGRMGCRSPAPGCEDDYERIIILSPGSGTGAPRSFAWRAATDRVEIYGSDGAALLRGSYDFLKALGARWIAPGAEGERLPRGPGRSLEAASRSSGGRALESVLVLGHGAFLERWEDYLLWAARAGCSAAMIRVARNDPALEGAPEELYEAIRPGLAQAAARLGLGLELALPSAGASDPEAFAGYAAAHGEISVFHLWPETPWLGAAHASAVPGPAPGGRAKLADAIAIADALGRARPDASLSIHVDESDADFADALTEARALPGNLGLLWAPRRRSWGSSLGDPSSTLNVAALSLFQKIAGAWRSAGGGRILALDRSEDAFLFKGAAPPLFSVVEGDLAAYRGGGQDGLPSAAHADAIGILCGGRRGLGLRPTPALLAELAADPDAKAGDLLAAWAQAAYGAASESMLGYWRELGAAWAVDLDIKEGETGQSVPASPDLAVSEPPIDWGDPRPAGAERLAGKRSRCEELFDHLRSAERYLVEAKSDAADSGEELVRLISAEADEYAISGAVLELNCARLSAYHESAAGDPRAAADIANLALSAAAALRKALSRLPDPRARREMRLVELFFYEISLKEVRRYNARSALRRLFDLWASKARLAWAIRRTSRAYLPRGGGRAESGAHRLARPEPEH